MALSLEMLPVGVSGNALITTSLDLVLRSEILPHLSSDPPSEIRGLKVLFHENVLSLLAT